MRGAGEVVVEGGVVVAVVVLVVVAAVGSRRTKSKKSLVGSGSFRGSQPRWENKHSRSRDSSQSMEATRGSCDF